MPFYLVKYSIGKNNKFIYPKSTKDVTWKSTMYHYTDHLMIGETDEDILADGNEIIVLDPNEAQKLKIEYRSSRPKLEERPEPIFFPKEIIKKRSDVKK